MAVDRLMSQELIINVGYRIDIGVAPRQRHRAIDLLEALNPRLRIRGTAALLAALFGFIPKPRVAQAFGALRN